MEKAKKYKRKIGKVPGDKRAYGSTDWDKKVITINKANHKKKSHGKGIRKNKDGTANMLDTMIHEEMHANHPKMHEKTVRRKTITKYKRLTREQKKKIYSRFS